jgi:prevent-host-death family protein
MKKTTPRKDRVRERAAEYGTLEVPASDLKVDWHHWLDQVSRGLTTVVVTRHGKPVAKLTPIEEGPPSALFGAMRGWILEEGDIVSPVGVRWDAENGSDEDLPAGLQP